MGLVLKTPPGFADLSDSVLVANAPALGLDIAKIYGNSAFGMVRPEVFVTGPYQNGETVPLPVSPIDGYAYQRNELIYIWTVQNSVDKSTGWITGKDSLWYVNYLVDQATGQVFIDEWYRRSGLHYDGVHTNDGTLTVFTIAQRQQTNLIMAAAASYSAITSGWIGLDEPLTQQLAQGLNDDAKFSVVNREVFYLGEFYDGQTVPQPVSPADGYTYSYAECQFMFAWRWTSPGNLTNLSAPLLADGQLGPMKASVSGSGVVSTSIGYLDSNGNLNTFNDGRIAVFAFCTRSATPGSISPVAANFTELSFQLFMPGQPLEYPIVQDILNNILEAVLTPEYFGPTTHQDGDVIALPTSPVDGYAYSRSELTYIWSFSDTTNATGTNLRMASFGGAIDQTTGTVHLYGYRLPPGGPYVVEDQTQPRISVIVVARRQAQAAAVIPTSTTTPAQGVTSSGPASGADVPTLSGVLFDVFNGNGSQTAFTLSGAPLGGFAFVFWNQGPVLPTDYSISGTTLTTNFKDAGGNSLAIPSGDKIYVVYFF